MSIIMKLDVKMMLLRMEYPLWSDEDLITRIKDKELSEKKVCYHGRNRSSVDNSLFWYHCDCCGKRY
jgi:hypothetical protein